MSYNAHDAYLESRILSADPIELVNLLYQGCSGAVRAAREHLASGEIAARSRSITKASEILIELASSLDHERGGELSQRLGQLYDYMLRRLIEANCHQDDAPLAEVLGLLSTLSEAWEGVKESEKPAASAADSWAQPVSQEPAPTLPAPEVWEGLNQPEEPSVGAWNRWAQAESPDAEPAYHASEAWEAQKQAEEPPVGAGNPGAQPQSLEPEPAYHSSQVWEGLKQAEEPPVSAGNPWAQPLLQEPASVYAFCDALERLTQPEKATATIGSPWAQPLPQEPEPVCAGQGWSF